MKYYSTLPLTALFALSLMTALVAAQVIPSGAVLLESIRTGMQDYYYWVIMLIIMLESIVYVGFYFPGQFFAVVLVVTANPTAQDILYLTFAMVAAATLGSAINYLLGRASQINNEHPSSAQGPSIKSLLLAMIHMNSLAFFMFAQGANKSPVKVIFLAGVLNLPYYLLIIATTAYLSDEVMQLAENTYVIFLILSVWLAISLSLDWRKRASGKV